MSSWRRLTHKKRRFILLLVLGPGLDSMPLLLWVSGAGCALWWECTGLHRWGYRWGCVRASLLPHDLGSREEKKLRSFSDMLSVTPKTSISTSLGPNVTHGFLQGALIIYIWILRIRAYVCIIQVPCSFPCWRVKQCSGGLNCYWIIFGEMKAG